MFTETVSYHAAFAAGLLSFFSPCVLPLIPAYFTFITGLSLDKLTECNEVGLRTRVVVCTLAYVSGFSMVFILMGASASILGGLIYGYREWIRILGGVIILILGLHMIGLFRIRGLEVEKRLHLQKKPVRFLGTFFVGMAFGAGWSPCIGPLLGTILIMAGNQETVWDGISLLTVYSMGLAIPFLLMSLFINFILVFLERLRKVMRYINIVAGSLLIVIGVLLITNKMNF